MKDLLAVKVSKPFDNLVHDIFALILVDFTNQIGKTTFSAVLKDNGKVLFLAVIEELTSFEDVGMI